jgi:hypothetical protein
MASVRPLGDPSRTPSGLFASGLKRLDNRYDVEVDFKIARKSGWLRSLADPGGFLSSQVDFVNVFVQQTSRQGIPAFEMVGKEISTYVPGLPEGLGELIARMSCRKLLKGKWKALQFADV